MTAWLEQIEPVYGEPVEPSKCNTTPSYVFILLSFIWKPLNHLQKINLF